MIILSIHCTKELVYGERKPIIGTGTSTCVPTHDLRETSCSDRQQEHFVNMTFQGGKALFYQSRADYTDSVHALALCVRELCFTYSIVALSNQSK